MSSSKDLRKKALRAFVMVTMKPGTSEEIVRSRRIKGVKMANSVLGRFDAVIVIEAESLEELKKIIYEMVEQHPNVVHTETLISIFHPPVNTV
ncbi:MAG: Lrp/AsnC ligand binding domain-containing protein [Candidatus Bathyarchaeota archaeon]|nr:Lrp/AsnC ligand binding domain-containing protein [Candidatus Bathyarchaeota archaeon]MCX8176682.1 Lrp/AsnC ligand binding domain-containing protein [Candidatus Bathyarchaeota archaeon]MDW8193209.1 Lrp/AsnC ligand binding domain-containing protein [Nitrososphaerota archaeon]